MSIGDAPGAAFLQAVGVYAGAAKTVATEYTFTNTLLKDAGERPYINSPLLIGEITSTGTGVADSTIAGALRYDVPGTLWRQRMNEPSRGTCQLVIHPASGQFSSLWIKTDWSKDEKMACTNLSAAAGLNCQGSPGLYRARGLPLPGRARLCDRARQRQQPLGDPIRPQRKSSAIAAPHLDLALGH